MLPRPASTLSQIVLSFLLATTVLPAQIHAGIVHRIPTRCCRHVCIPSPYLMVLFFRRCLQCPSTMPVFVSWDHQPDPRSLLHAPGTDRDGSPDGRLTSFLADYSLHLDWIVDCRTNSDQPLVLYPWMGLQPHLLLLLLFLFSRQRHGYFTPDFDHLSRSVFFCSIDRPRTTGTAAVC